MSSRCQVRLPRRRAVAPFALILVALLAGCSPREQQLARVGPRTITVGDFMEVARSNGEQYPGAAQDARAMLFEDLVRRDLMLAAADHMGLFKDSATVRFRRDTEEQTLARALYRRLAPSDISVSTAEVDSFYRWRGTESHLALIFVSNRAAADAAMNALRRGEPFDSVADRFSPSRMLPPGGDMGYLTSGSLVDPLDSFLHTAPVGKLLGPVEAPGQGWFIARILDRRPVRNRPAPDVERPWLANAIQQRKQRAVSTKAFTDLAAEYHVRVEPGAAQDLFMIAIHQRAATDGSGDPTPEQRARVLVRYEDGNGHPLTFTVADALANIEARPADRPNFMMMPAIQTWLQSQAVQRAAVLEARRRHIGEEPAIAHEIEERVNNHVLEQVFTKVVQDATEPSEEEIQAAYQRHASSYLQLHGVHVLHATFPDSASAAALMLHGGHSGTMREAAQMAGSQSPVVEERVPFPNPREPWKSMQATFMSMGPREWSGPIRTPGGWMVVQLLEKQEEPQPLAQLAPVIQQSLRDEALAFRRDRKLTRYTDSLRTVVKPFELSPERLNRIPWPVPPAANGAGT